MKPNHMNFEEVMLAYKETGAKIMIPMHYLTFNLSCESMHEPLEKVHGHSGTGILPLKIGEVYFLNSFFLDNNVEASRNIPISNV